MGAPQQVDDPQRWTLALCHHRPAVGAPPAHDELQAAALRDLSAKSWSHPVSGLPVQFSMATLNRWYYASRFSPDPVSALRRKRRPKRNTTPGAQQAAERLERCEVRSFEAAYADALWHSDFPRIASGLDPGRPVGLHTLGILHESTLPYSPCQNAKQEVFRATLEGRLMAMLEGVDAWTLERLNEITQVWLHGDYRQVMHSEIAASPLQRYRDAPQAGRNCPNFERLRQAFRCTVKRRQRRSDGSVSLSGRRFEIRARYRHIEQPLLRCARWDFECRRAARSQHP